MSLSDYATCFITSAKSRQELGIEFLHGSSNHRPRIRWRVVGSHGKAGEVLLAHDVVRKVQTICEETLNPDDCYWLVFLHGEVRLCSPLVNVVRLIVYLVVDRSDDLEVRVVVAIQISTDDSANAGICSSLSHNDLASFISDSFFIRF